MGPTKEQREAMKRQKMEEQRSQNKRVKTMQQDLSQQTMDIFRRFGSSGMAGSSIMPGSSPLRRG